MALTDLAQLKTTGELYCSTKKIFCIQGVGRGGGPLSLASHHGCTFHIPTCATKYLQ